LATGRTGDDDEAKQIIWTMGKKDLFFLLYFVLNQTHLNHPWLVPKICEAQEEHNHCVFEWSRETYKSTIFTFGLPIWKIIRNWNTAIGLFSHTRGIARGNFLRRIKRELENNEVLKLTWPANSENPGGFWLNPEKESPKWSETEGLLVQRKRGFNHPNETIEAWGVTEGMPTSAHYFIKIYDDLVTWDSTRTADQINKTKEGFDLTVPLGVTEGGEEWIVGTPYDYNDLYAYLEREKKDLWKIIKYRADILPSIWTKEQIEHKRKEYSNPYNFSCQISLNPIPSDKQKLLYDWLQWHNGEFPETNDLILVDPAGEKKGHSSFTVIWHLGADAYKRFYIKNIVRDKLNLKERCEKLFWMASQCEELPRVGYEKYSFQADIEYIQEKQEEQHIYFETDSEGRQITPLGGSTAKDDRIRGLIPYLVDKKIVLPREYWYTDIEGKSHDLIKDFLNEEYIHFPNTTWKDMLDCLARITDMNIVYPNIKRAKTEPRRVVPWWIQNFTGRTWSSR